ncbi:diguanylate cyclase/phosphodiesterase (GGDEF & EAL domains) with PAS/PAC sensor(s) [hydrothermal vent metagenome]|uniref:Diguanylate cyclase/phosphodiesterase (GGDEF & EAL domains) with PAS/PAC sensor(S) n=1 Tax=hydrothermal vent metagenome TaxID=652676 RepID=A0A3B0YKG6_9ZZZZ
MRLSTQMLTGIVGITVLSQAIFGLIAYWIVLGVEQDHLLQLLRQRTDEVAQSIAIPLATGTPSSQALEQSGHHYAPSVDVLVLQDSQGIVAVTGSWAKRIDSKVLGKQLKRESTLSLERITLTGKPFLVTSSRVPGLPYRIVSLQQNHVKQDNLINRLGSRFFVFSIIILWIAVWISLLLAAMINRKLEKKTAALRHEVTHDTLTGLPNRAKLYQQLERATASENKVDTHLAVLTICINHFMEINDTLGYDLGDQLLLEMSGRLQQALPEGSFISRLDGDEFVVVLIDADQEQTKHFIQQLLTSLDMRVHVNQIELEVSLTIGASLYPKQATDTDALLRYADIALRQARERSTDFVFYDGELDQHSVRRLTLSAELNQAIQRGQLVVFYQPKISVESGTVYGLEALVRWDHPEYGLIPPDDFIPLAEQTGSIRELTAWVLEESLHFLHRLHSRGMLINIAVNISTQSLHDDQLKPLIEKLLQRTGVASHYLYLEVTETVMMKDIDHAQSVLYSLHDMGVKISIDDFGTGFSSLAYLNRLPVDEIKVDRSFVMPMLEQHSEQTIVLSIIELAHTLSCTVVAEGVENQATLALLGTMGCDIAQGYLLTKPIPMNEIEQWLERYQPKPAQRELPKLSEASDSV